MHAAAAAVQRVRLEAVAVGSVGGAFARPCDWEWAAARDPTDRARACAEWGGFRGVARKRAGRRGQGVGFVEDDQMTTKF